MGILRNAKKAALVEEQKNDVTWDGSRGWTVVRGNDPDTLPDNFEEYIVEGLRKNPVVAACVREIQTSLSEAPIKVFRPENDDEILIPQHELSELFNFPNSRDSYVTFIERSAQHFLLGGNSFWWKVRDGMGIPQQLIPIRPDRVLHAETNEHGFPLSFTIRIGDKHNTDTETIPFDDIVHIPDADPLNEVFGLPRIMAATLDIATDNEASNYVNEVLGNFGSPGTVVTVDGQSSKIKRSFLERAEEMWQQKFGPGRGRGKVAFIPGGQQVQQIGFNLRDLEFEELRQITRESICAAFGIDPMVVNISTASRGGTMSGNEHQEARRKLWVQTLIPLIRRWEAAINAFLAPEWGDVVARFDLSDIGALQEDRDNQVERARKMVQAGATLGESRAEMGLDPEPEDEDFFVISRNMKIVPVAAFDSDMTLAEAEGNESSEENSSDNDTEEEDSERTVHVPEGKPLPKPEEDEEREDFIDRCMSNETAIEDFPDEDQRFAVCQDLWEDE